MQIETPAIAGTLESSDAQVTVEPCEEGLDLSVHSTVIAQYGRQIRETAMETLKRLGVENASVMVNDHGALDCTLRARIECAVFRAANVTKDYPWEEVIQP